MNALELEQTINIEFHMENNFCKMKQLHSWMFHTLMGISGSFIKTLLSLLLLTIMIKIMLYPTCKHLKNIIVVNIYIYILLLMEF